MLLIKHFTRAAAGTVDQSDIFRVFVEDPSVGHKGLRAVLDVRVFTAPVDLEDAPPVPRAIYISAVGHNTFQETLGRAGLYAVTDESGNPDHRVRQYDIGTYLAGRLHTLMGRVYAPNAPTIATPLPLDDSES